MVVSSLQQASRYAMLHPKFAEAFAFLARPDLAALPTGKQVLDGERMFALIQDYQTKPRSEGVLEAHRRYIDIQFIVSGVEAIGYAPYAVQPEREPFTPERDIGFYLGTFTPCRLEAGMLAILWPEDAHAPGLQADDSPAMVRKVVIKVEA